MDNSGRPLIRCHTCSCNDDDDDDDDDDDECIIQTRIGDVGIYLIDLRPNLPTQGSIQRPAGWYWYRLIDHPCDMLKFDMRHLNSNVWLYIDDEKN